MFENYKVYLIQASGKKKSCLTSKEHLPKNQKNAVKVQTDFCLSHAGNM